METIKVALPEGKTETVKVKYTFFKNGRLWAIHAAIDSQVSEKFPTLHCTDVLTGYRLRIAHTYEAMLEKAAKEVLEQCPEFDFSQYPIINPFPYEHREH